jgi:hypothetical protein
MLDKITDSPRLSLKEILYLGALRQCIPDGVYLS